MTRFAIGRTEMRHFQGSSRRAATTALFSSAASPANEPISNNSSVSKRLCTYPNALPVSGSAHPIVPPSPMWPYPSSSPGTGDDW